MAADIRADGGILTKPLHGVWSSQSRVGARPPAQRWCGLIGLGLGDEEHPKSMVTRRTTGNRSVVLYRASDPDRYVASFPIIVRTRREGMAADSSPFLTSA
jgi:hypothetical protein